MTVENVNQQITPIEKVNPHMALVLLVCQVEMTVEQRRLAINAIATDPRLAADLFRRRVGITADERSKLVEAVCLDWWESKHTLTGPTRYALTPDQIDRLVGAVAKDACASWKLITSSSGPRLTATQLEVLLETIIRDSLYAAHLLAAPRQLTADQITRLRVVVAANSPLTL